MNKTTHIDFSVRADDLGLDNISAKLGFSPTSGFNANETYQGKVRVGDRIRTVERRRPAFGVWHFSTEEFITSSRLEDHAEFLLRTLEPVEAAIGELLRARKFSLQITLWHVGPVGFDLESATVARLARFCTRMSFTWVEVSE